MEIDMENEMRRDCVLFYSVVYSSVTVVFALAVLTKFLTNEFRFGFRSSLSLAVLFLGEPLCQFIVEGPIGVTIFTLGCLIVYYILPAGHLPIDNQSVLITGCDSGFGHALAEKLDKLGLQVFAGCLDNKGPGATELKEKCSSKLRVVKLDVTLSSDVAEAFQLIKNHVGERGLWGLVNNAGVWYFSELGMTHESIVQKVMEVNMFGVVRVTRAMLPLIKQAQGRVINVSSLLGRLSLEGCGVYSMSKHAMVAYTNTLRMEMKKWGVSVSLVEPGGFFTGNMQEQILQKRKDEIWLAIDEETQKIYGKEYFDSAYAQIITSSATLPRDLSPVIRCLRSGLLSKRPRERYPCGAGAAMMLSLYPLLPVWLADCFSQSISILPKQLKPHALSGRS